MEIHTTTSTEQTQVVRLHGEGPSAEPYRTRTPAPPHPDLPAVEQQIVTLKKRLLTQKKELSEVTTFLQRQGGLEHKKRSTRPGARTSFEELPDKIENLRKHLATVQRPCLPDLKDPKHFLWAAQQFNRDKDYEGALGQLANRVVKQAKGDLQGQICFERALAHRQLGSFQAASTAALEGLRFAANSELRNSLNQYLWNGESSSSSSGAVDSLSAKRKSPVPHEKRVGKARKVKKEK